MVGLVVFVAGAYAIEKLAGLDGPLHVGPLLAAVMSAIPALLWVGYFYLQDRNEPEPKHYVFGVYLVGAFVAAPVAQFLIDMVAPDTTSGVTFATFSAERVVWAVLVVGVAQELAKYAVVRYSIYLSPEFDEPMDGIIYMTAAGIGFATYENYQYLQGLHGTVFMSTGAANAVVATLAHGCFAGVLGYALGLAKFSGGTSGRRQLILVAGLAAAAVLNGVFALIEDVVKTSGLDIQPWRGVAYAAGFAAVVFFAISLLMRRHLAISPHKEGAR